MALIGFASSGTTIGAGAGASTVSGCWRLLAAPRRGTAGRTPASGVGSRVGGWASLSGGVNDFWRARLISGRGVGTWPPDASSLLKCLAGELRAVVDRAPLKRSGAENPHVVRRAFLVGEARLPDRRARFAVIGKDGDLGDAPLVAALGEGDFRDRRRHRLHERDLRHVHRRHAEQQIVAVGANGAGPRFDDEVGLVALVAQLAAAGQADAAAAC